MRSTEQVKDFLKSGNNAAALALLAPVVRADPGDIDAWWLLSFALDDLAKQIYAVQRVLQLSPNNTKAQARLQKLQASQPVAGYALPSQPTTQPPAPRPMAPASALTWQMPQSSAVTATREGRVWAGLIAAGLVGTALVAGVLTLTLRAAPASAGEQPAQFAAALATNTSLPPTAEPTLPQPSPTAQLLATDIPPTPTVEVQPTAAPTLAPTATEDTTVTLVTDTAGADALDLPVFDQFVQSVENGNGDQRVGVFVEGLFQYPIVQQPSNEPAWITSSQGEVTEFRIVRQQTGNEGLIAHNYLAGGKFFELEVGDVAQVVLGDGTVLDFEVAEIYDFQALTPNSPTSDFLNLDTGAKLSASELFYKVYGGNLTLTFQTCINRNNISTWGRTFIVGEEL
jgi:hypothetical protein